MAVLYLALLKVLNSRFRNCENSSRAHRASTSGEEREDWQTSAESNESAYELKIRSFSCSKSDIFALGMREQVKNDVR